MIYTVTFNPSLDYVIQVDDLTLGEVNRTTSEKIYPGGKGNNVSVILSNLGHKSKALGFKAGFTGEQMETMLEEFGCYTDFIPLEEGLTRINVKVKSNEESEINGQGPEIPEKKVEELSLGLFIKRNPKFKIKQLRLIVLKTVAIQKNTLLSLTMDIV